MKTKISPSENTMKKFCSTITRVYFALRPKVDIQKKLSRSNRSARGLA